MSEKTNNEKNGGAGVIEFELYLTDYNDLNQPVQPDEKDEKIAIERIRKWNNQNGPRVGDFIIMPDGKYERFAYDWGEGLQTCTGGSFYFGNCGASMSGGLNPVVPREKIQITNETKDGRFWFFHNDNRMAHNAVGLLTPCRVFRNTQGA